jgi:Holliday junction resolvasome RuvABC DNA-binding subunit
VLPTLSAVEDDVLSALLNLGYQRAAAESALEKAPKNRQSFDVIFREALAALTR